MGIFFCAVCLFTFPKPAAATIDDVRHTIERQYSREMPWSEAGGPFVKVKLALLTPEFGIADATLTTVGATWVNKRDIRVRLKKDGEVWKIVPGT